MLALSGQNVAFVIKFDNREMWRFRVMADNRAQYFRLTVMKYHPCAPTEKFALLGKRCSSNRGFIAHVSP
jgi:hypothetical protein